MYDAVKIAGVRPLRDHVIVDEMNFGERTTRSGVILRSDDAKLEGIRPRWARVYAVGPENTDVKPGDWILVSHGRWTRGVNINDGVQRTIRRVDRNDILAVSDQKPSDDDIAQGI